MLRFMGIGLVACAIVLALVSAWMVIRSFVHLLVVQSVDGRVLSPRGRGVLRDLVAQLIFLAILLAFIGFAAAHGPNATLALAGTAGSRLGAGLFALRLLQDVVNRRRVVSDFGVQRQRRFATIFGFSLTPVPLIVVAFIPVPLVRLIAFLSWSAVVAAGMLVVMRTSGDGSDVPAEADRPASERPNQPYGNTPVVVIPKRLDVMLGVFAFFGLAAVVIYSPVFVF